MPWSSSHSHLIVLIWTFWILALPKPFDESQNESWGVNEGSNVMGDAGRAPVVDAYGM